jgi:hypothetical protein
MEIKNILLVLTLVIIVTMMIHNYNKNSCDCNDNEGETEKYANTDISNEALGNIASIYNNNNLTATNITSTDTLTSNKSTAATNTTTNLTATNLTATNATLNNAKATSFIGGDIKLSKGWTGYPDNATDKSEISNDTNGYKTLMIVGNKSNDAAGPRRVGVWDDLTAYGTFNVNNRAKFRVMDNMQAADGWDNYDSGDNKSPSFQDCVNTCAGRNSLCAMFSKSRKHCWCKNLIGLKSNNSPDFTTVFMI